MIIWLDAQLSPALAAWINREFTAVEAHSVGSLGLLKATDREIFLEAKNQGAVVMSKDIDFVNLVSDQGPPPKVIWITCGNTSNKKIREILSSSLQRAVDILNQGESIVEIQDKNLSA